MTREEFELAMVTPMCKKCLQRAESILLKDEPRRAIMTESHYLEKPRLTTSYRRKYSDLCFYHARVQEDRYTNFRVIRLGKRGDKR